MGFVAYCRPEFVTVALPVEPTVVCTATGGWINWVSVHTAATAPR